MKYQRTPFLLPAALTLSALFIAESANAETAILNVSYDVSRELYRAINPSFSDFWKAKTGERITINQSHGGSTRQVLSVIDGLKADVLTLNQVIDMEKLVEEGKVGANWRDAYPNQAVPYTTTTVFLVRKGNPRAIKDWPDLIKDGVQVVLPNPKLSGNGRYGYLAAYGYALKKWDSHAEAGRFVRHVINQVPVMDGGGRSATTTFTQRGIGDVLVTFENEAQLIRKELSHAGFEVVYPSLSVEVSAPVARAENIQDSAEREVAEAYIEFLFQPETQQIIAEHGFRPFDQNVLAQYQSQFPQIETFQVETLIGPWQEVQNTHFAPGGLLDRILRGQP